MAEQARNACLNHRFVVYWGGLLGCSTDLPSDEEVCSNYYRYGERYTDDGRQNA